MCGWAGKAATYTHIITVRVLAATPAKRPMCFFCNFVCACVCHDRFCIRVASLAMQSQF